ncbi:MAG: FCD domain-containing protein [Luteitalea sp.]|nr:FCD domain-containing protein [Luteitalea sp.]
MMVRARASQAGYPSRNLHGQIVHAIGRQILRGDLRPGEPVPVQRDLPASRTALREAIKVLAAKGLVETRPKTGTRVRTREAWNLLDPDVLAWRQAGAPPRPFLRSLTEVRNIIEPAAAALAAKRARAADIAAIERAYRDMEAAMPTEAVADVTPFVEADTRFHAAILQAGGNDILEQMSRVVYAALRVSLEATSRIPGSARASLPRHRAVLDAIRARKPRRAAEAMQRLVHRIARKVDVIPRRVGRGNLRHVETKDTKSKRRNDSTVKPRPTSS